MEGIVNPSTIVKIEGEGMPVRGTPGCRGDLFVKFNIVFPSFISFEDKHLLAEIL